MLRALLIALVLANLAVWAWRQPAVAHALGLPGPDSQRDPDRLNRQINPQAVRVLRGSAAAPTPSASAAPAAVPRHPAWTAATAPVRRSAMSSGTQSAARITRATSVAFETSASALAGSSWSAARLSWSMPRSIVTTSRPCTWLRPTTRDGSAPTRGLNRGQASFDANSKARVVKA